MSSSRYGAVCYKYTCNLMFFLSRNLFRRHCSPGCRDCLKKVPNSLVFSQSSLTVPSASPGRTFKQGSIVLVAGRISPPIYEYNQVFRLVKKN